MNTLPEIRPSSIGGEPVQTIDARDLHAFLEVSKDFSDWIKAQISRARLVENRDYVALRVFAQKGENLTGGRPRIEYALTLEAGKHIAMMSGTDKGFEVREYFIECERRAKAGPSIDPLAILNDPAAMRGLLLTYSEKVLALEEKVAEQAPKAEALDRIATADGLLNLTAAAKTLQYPPRKLSDWLTRHRWVYRRPGGGRLLAYQEKIQAGYLTHKLYTERRDDGDRVHEQVLVTPKGLARLAHLLSAGGVQ